jgi:murein DD-endopeptidase MepM/ murein hydrolase activator NlpD
MKRVVIHFFIILLILGSIPFVEFSAYDFEENEAYYSNLCSSVEAKDHKDECSAYQEYVNDKANQAQRDLNELRNQLKDLKTNILKLAADVTKYEKQIEDLNSSITNIEKSIATSEASIDVLKVNIEAREANINEIDEFIQNRMVSMQSFIYLNSYIDFIVGAQDFVDLVRRIEGINDITNADKQEIERLTEEVNAFNADKEELERQVTILEENKANLVKNRETVIELQESVEKILLEYRTQEAELMAKESYIASNLDQIQEKLRSISAALNNVVTSDGFIWPIASGFRVTATVWTYPYGGTHLGTDLGAPVGTNLRAVGNGVVLYSANACPTYGFYGNNCGSPGINRGGNQVILLVSIDGGTYGIIYMHLEKDTAIEQGRIVNQGDSVGKVGSSGSSTGPHLHIEIHYLGTKNISEYAASWNGDLSFGNKWGNAGYDRRCDYNGNVAPCRKNPSSVFGIRYGQYY